MKSSTSREHTLCPPDFKKVRHGRATMYLRYDLDPQEVLQKVCAPGDVLKQSKKAIVRRVDSWVIKATAEPWPVRVARLNFKRDHGRGAWRAALFLRDNGVLAPPPLAFIEYRAFGAITGNLTITGYIENARNVEQYLVALVQRGLGQAALGEYLVRLADAINGLAATGAYHADLSGKNILTQDGESFYFIDCDAVTVDQPVSSEARLKNFIQLYDSFCDMLNDTMLYPFITRMMPPDMDPRVWMPQVRSGQIKRRRRVEEIWARQGVPPRRAGQ